MTDKQKRKISVGFFKPSRLEGDTIYAQILFQRHASGGPDYVDYSVISNVPFDRMCHMWGTNMYKKKELVREVTIRGARFFENNGEYQYKNHLRKFAEINNAEIDQIKLEDEGLDLIKELGNAQAYLRGIQSSAHSGFKSIDEMFK